MTEYSEESQMDPLPPAPMGRRRFLNALASGAALLVAACRPALQPTATPMPEPTLGALASATSTAHRQFMPLVHDGHARPLDPTATLTPMPTLEPTLTPTPSKTATPPPPPTPTPVATPFPPGPPSKLGLFVARNDPQIFDLLATGGVPVVKTLELDANFAGQIKQVSPRTRLIGRIDLPQLRLAQLEPMGAARDFVNKLLIYADDSARRPYFDAWEAYNEPVAGSLDEMKRLADFESERIRLLGERGIRSVVGNFGAGQPPLEHWEAFLPALQTAKAYDGWLGLHEYSAPTIYHLSTRDGQGRYPGVGPGDTGWLTLRYRQVYNQILRPAGLDLPLVMTELGVDGLVTDRPGPANARGWQHFQRYWAENGFGLWGPGAYVEQLVWYDQAMQQDAYVLGSCIYAMAASQGWESYDILGPASVVLEQYLRVHAPG